MLLGRRKICGGLSRKWSAIDGDDKGFLLPWILLSAYPWLFAYEIPAA